MGIDVAVLVRWGGNAVRVIGYIRVSTENQVDGFGLDVQEKAIRTWARDGGHRLAHIYREEGISGAKELDDRPALAEAMEALKAKQADGIVFPKLDRLSRELVLQETLIAAIWKMGAQVFSAVPSEADYLVDDPADPGRKLIRQVFGAVAEYERSIIALRLRSGRAQKAAKGGYAYGAPGFGQRAEGKQLVDDDREQAALARMVQLRGEGLSLRQVAVALDEEGFPPKRAERWHSQQVARCLARIVQ